MVYQVLAQPLRTAAHKIVDYAIPINGTIATVAGAVGFLSHRWCDVYGSAQIANTWAFTWQKGTASIWPSMMGGEKMGEWLGWGAGLTSSLLWVPETRPTVNVYFSTCCAIGTSLTLNFIAIHLFGAKHEKNGQHLKVMEGMSKAPSNPSVSEVFPPLTTIPDHEGTQKAVKLFKQAIEPGSVLTPSATTLTAATTLGAEVSTPEAVKVVSAKTMHVVSKEAMSDLFKDRNEKFAKLGFFDKILSFFSCATVE